MDTTIKIRKLRHIQSLDFKIPRPGVWLLTGENGTGKTSLLGCLRRVGFSNAFPHHFPASRKSDQLDSSDGASIQYETPEGTVTYSYRTERWAPSPKEGSHYLKSIGFPDVVYIAANADRIEPNKDDFSPRRVKAAKAPIITAANQIFCTKKFNALKTINVRKGIGSEAFLLELPVPEKQKKQYFSEKNLSLGELCILKLLRILSDIPKGSMVLIDELELALHPTAQTELLKYLHQIADQKSLTVIVSTHSSTLIKQAERKQILLLQTQDDGSIICTANCYPSFILGAIAYQEESASDVVIYVEDEAARTIVEQLSQRFIADQFKQDALLPSVNAIAVGGIANVVRFFVRQKPLLPSITRAYVMLDADAEETLDNSQVEEIIRIYREQRQYISFLPVTPEVGLASYLNSHRANILSAIRKHFSLNTLSLRANDVGAMPDANAPKYRDLCKTIVSGVSDHLANQLPNSSSTEVKQTLFKLLAEHLYADNRPKIMQLLGPIIRG
ncbi:ATP-dependent nuclease [Janthinobacterium sp. GMG1]|uniref:ATP-dependent nuclease n=1 Tax=Janthinobacterium sp. GMG1 TaxID=3096007 RepID=UPI002ACA96D8|nr:AAA family ATPase [Janthinobacterium sp. GMG1]MDZ5631906.1 AAA family ATPase [Janthinobacterium sp. GMG1]